MRKEQFETKLIKKIKKANKEKVFDIITWVREDNVAEKRLIAYKNGTTFSYPVTINEMYKRYLSGESVRNLANEVIDKIAEEEQKPIDLFEYEQVKDYVMLRPASATEQESLNQKPNRNFLDFSIVYEIAHAATGIVDVTNEMMGKWKVTEKELYKKAYHNTFNRRRPFAFSPEAISLLYMTRKEQKQYLSMIHNNGPYIITNKMMYHGSISMLYNDFMDQIASELETDELYVIPISIHDSLLYDSHKLNYPVMEIARHIKEMTFPEHQMSPNVYYYNVKERRVKQLSYNN